MKLPSFKVIKSVLGNKAPTILVVLSIGGLIGTTIMAVNATPKALKLIEDEAELRDDNDEEPMTKVDVVKLTWTYYIPTAAMAAATIATIIGGHTLSLKRNAALTTAYYLSETALKEYQAKVIQIIGEKKNKLIKDEIAQDHVNRTKKNEGTVIITGNGQTLCLDLTTGRYFRSSVDKIKKAENDINYQLLDDMWMSLNEIYDYIGLEHVSCGSELGWDINKDGKLNFDISTQMSEDDEPCITIKFNARPKDRG